MFEAMERGDLRALYVIGENPLQSEADQHHARHLLEGLDFLLVQDLFLTKTAELAEVVLPASAAWCESEGTVTNSERRVQRVRKAVDAPAGAHDDLTILFDLAKRLGHDWGRPDAETIWNEVRGLSPDARRDELRAPGKARRAPVAVLRRRASGRDVPAQSGSGSGRFAARASRSSRSSTIRPLTSSTRSFRCA
jgi:anaerobic selenocysteine-containing dehydrogenase